MNFKFGRMFTWSPKCYTVAFTRIIKWKPTLVEFIISRQRILFKKTYGEARAATLELFFIIISFVLQ